MDTLLQDLRFAARTLRKQPAFTAIVILTLALATGANTGAFTFLYGILLRPLPFPTADRLVALTTRNTDLGVEHGDLSIRDLDDLRAACSSCAEVVGVEESNVVFDAGRAPQRLRDAEISPGLFRALGIGPAMGRGLNATGPGTEAAAEILISHRLWRRLGEDPKILGRKVLLDGEPRVVVGVMPAGFHFPERADLWGPIVRATEASRTNRDLDGAYVLLGDGASLESLRAEVAGIGRRLAGEYPKTNAGWTIRVAPLRSALVNTEMRTVLFLMSGAVAFVLLIACANVANLLLARQAARRREVAIRAALGCDRWRIARQLLTESLVLSALGGGLGVLFAAWSVDYVRSSSPERLPYWMRLEIQGEVLFFTLGTIVATALLISALPAWRAGRPELHAELHRGAPGAGTRQRLQRVLVVGQIALAVILVFGAGLLIRTSMAMLAADPGFDSRNLVTLRTILIGPRYREPAARGALMAQAIERLEALPGVEHAAFTGSLPLDEGGADVLLSAEGTPDVPGIVVSSTAGLFDALAPLVRGRPFTAHEAGDPESRVAIVNQGLAERFWPDENPIGQRLRLAAGGTLRLTVVGVAPDLHYEELGEATPRSRVQVHLPYARSPWRSMSLLVRTSSDPRPLLEPVRQAIAALDPTLVVYNLRTLDDVRYHTTWGQRIRGQAFGTFALIALLLGAVGVYGVMSFGVSQRVHEIGVRMAIGADRGAVSALVLGEGMALAAIGVGIGIAGTALLSRAMESVVWGISSTDLTTFVASPLVLLAAAAVASYLPARRAAGVDPLVVLRSE